MKLIRASGIFVLLTDNQKLRHEDHWIDVVNRLTYSNPNITYREFMSLDTFTAFKLIRNQKALMEEINKQYEKNGG